MQNASHGRTRIREILRWSNRVEKAVGSESSNHDLVSRWRAGDQFAARILVDRYMARLTALARANLSRRIARRVDPEDIVLSAWRSFFIATRGGRIEVPSDDELWPLLLTLTLRKLRRQIARHMADKRSVSDERTIDAASAEWIEAVSRDPTREEAARAADQLESLLSVLSADEREIVVQRLQGWTNSEIAEQLGVSEKTVRRALVRIREHAASLLRETDKSCDESDSPAPPDASIHHQVEIGGAIDFARVEESDLLIQRFAGQGAFGKVYRAIDRRTSETVAVKFLGKRFWRHPAAVERFETEIALLTRLQHPNIVRIHGSGRTAAGAPYFVMEYIDGSNLMAWREATSPSIAAVIDVATNVAVAVAAAHLRNIIHGDVTPSNVLRESSTGRIILTDFGFSRVTHQQRLALLGGTPGFLAPEQVSDAFGEVSVRTDVYGIGGILYALLTGRPPSTGASLPEVIARVLSSRPTAIPQEVERAVPSALAELTLACLAKEPADRPRSADAVVDRLRMIAQTL